MSPFLPDRRYLSFDRHADQHYKFRQHATELPIEITADGFTWPEISADTALLAIDVRAGWATHFAHPWIEAVAGDCRVRQYFERGARGCRLANVSDLLAAPLRPGDRVRLRGEHMKWKAQTGRLYGFQTKLPTRPRVLVIAPHPDDAEIAAFGLYQRSESFIATITAGDHGGFLSGRQRTHPEAHAGLTARVRFWDSLTVPFLGGVPPERCVNLAYPDSELADLFTRREQRAESSLPQSYADLRRMNLSPLTPPAPDAPGWRGLVADLVHLLRAVQPDIVATPHPLLDDHPDHAFTTLAVCEALAQAGSADGQMLLYVNHSPRSSLYPFGANDGVISVPPHFGEPAPFSTIYSEPLPLPVRELKLLALEAMHDLRSMPVDDPPTWPRLIRKALAETRGKVTGLGRVPTSYYRRAVRPNELFFVLPFSDAPALSECFLEEHRAGRLRWYVCP